MPGVPGMFHIGGALEGILEPEWVWSEVSGMLCIGGTLAVLLELKQVQAGAPRVIWQGSLWKDGWSQSRYVQGMLWYAPCLFHLSGPSGA